MYRARTNTRLVNPIYFINYLVKIIQQPIPIKPNGFGVVVFIVVYKSVIVGAEVARLSDFCNILFLYNNRIIGEGTIEIYCAIVEVNLFKPPKIEPAGKY